MRETILIPDGSELRALALERHIKNYTPQSWKEPISVAVGTPEITPDDLRELESSHAAGTLTEVLREKYPRAPYIVEAVENFFDKQK